MAAMMTVPVMARWRSPRKVRRVHHARPVKRRRAARGGATNAEEATALLTCLKDPELELPA